MVLPGRWRTALASLEWRRKAARIEAAISSDTSLAGRFAVFNRLELGEAMPALERVTPLAALLEASRSFLHRRLATIMLATIALSIVTVTGLVALGGRACAPVPVIRVTVGHVRLVPARLGAARDCPAPRR